MHQLQLIGIKTNLESFVTTTLMEHMLNRHQLHLFLWVSKQWGKSTGQTTTFPIAFTVSALNGFTQYNETGNATGNADQTITSLSKTSITTYRGYGYNYWVIGH